MKGSPVNAPFQSLVTPAHPRIMAERPVKISAREVDVYYGDKRAIDNLSIDIPDRAVSAFIGPSGCGKSTFLRAINRMNDTIPTSRFSGSIVIDGKDIYDRGIDVVQLRAQVGMVFQKPNPFPKSIYENVAPIVSTCKRACTTPLSSGWRPRPAASWWATASSPASTRAR